MPAGRAVGARAARAARTAAAPKFSPALVGENTHQLAHLFAPALGAGDLGAAAAHQFLEFATALRAVILINGHEFPLVFNLIFTARNVKWRGPSKILEPFGSGFDPNDRKKGNPVASTTGCRNFPGGKREEHHEIRGRQRNDLERSQA